MDRTERKKAVQAEVAERIRKAYGIEKFNAMQTAVAASDSADLILISPTGSGKTIAFAMAMLQRMQGDGHPSGLVIAPSRELVLQITDVLRAVTPSDMRVAAVYGGNAFAAEQASLQASPTDILVATPGRLLDHLNRGTLSVDGVSVLVFDEYDKTLELGFLGEVGKIVRLLRNVRSTILTSATALDEYPAFISAESAETVDVSESADAEGRVVVMDVPSVERDKLDTLAALLRSVVPQGGVMVFVNHRDAAERVADGLRRRKIDAVLYHGGLEQREREVAVARFAGDASRVLVCTDLAARGLDIDGVRSVVHYHMPTSRQAWTHRNGRTGRAGASGEIYVITGPDENIPEYVVTDHSYYPDMTATNAMRAPMAMLYFSAGKRDKVSRGDIAGFLMKQCDLPREAVGRITVSLSYSLAAVDRRHVAAVLALGSDTRLKGHRVRVSLLK